MDKTAEVTPGHMLTLTPRHVMAYHKLNLALADFLNQAFDDVRNAGQVRVDIMLGQVAVRTLNYIDIVSEPFTEAEKAGLQGCAQECTCEHNPLEIAYERYVDHIGRHSERTIAEVPPVALDLIAKERFDLIVKLHGLQYPDRVVLPDEGNPELKAWNAARASHRHELQRIGVLFFLGSQIPPKTSGVLRQRVEAEVLAALDYLMNRAAGFLEVEKDLAEALGGEAFRQTQLDQRTD